MHRGVNAADGSAYISLSLGEPREIVSRCDVELGKRALCEGDAVLLQESERIQILAIGVGHLFPHGIILQSGESNVVLRNHGI